MSRRPMGALEAEVLERLWSSESSMTPAQVLDVLEGDLAYTTVMTILARLWQKGLVERVKTGRAFSYKPVTSQADVMAGRMREQLAQSQDVVATMSHFVSGLNPTETEELRKLLEAKKR